MYFPLLDVLRFLAAVFVMLFHYFSSKLALDAHWYLYPILYGYMGVELFFIISGLVIYFSLQRPIKEYALGRFLRLYPLFWVLCTITYLCTLFMKDGHPLALKYYFANLLIVQSGTFATMIDGSYWTLTIEVLFYILIGTFVYIFSTKRLEFFYTSWLFVTLLIFFAGLQDVFITKALLIRYSPYFIFGGVLGLAIHTWSSSSLFKKVRYLLLLTISALAPLYISYKLYGTESAVTNRFGVFDIPASIIVELFFIIVPLAVYFSQKIPKGKWIVVATALGGITYPLYLLHQKIGSLIIGTFGTYGDVSFISFAVAIGMILVSYGIYRIEEPLRKRAFKKLAVLPLLNKEVSLKTVFGGRMRNDKIEAP